MSTIRHLSFIGLEYAFAPEKAYGMSRGGGFRRQGGLVEVETDAGVTGIGEAFGNPFVTREYFRMIEPFFVGKSVFDFEHIEARIRNSMYHLGVGNQLTACLAGINVALFDAIARGFGVRLCDLVGGCRTTRIPAYASTGFFSDDPARQLSHMLAEAAGHPYAGAKIKIGRGLKSDLERVRQARTALGPDKLLMVDINGAYTVDVALECARAIAPFDIHWIEEPLPPGDFAGYAELRARSPIPVAAGEAHHTMRDFRALIDGRCVDIVQPSIPGVGGLTEARRIATLALAANVRLAPHVWGGAVGLATALHFVAAQPASPHVDHPPHPQMLEYDMSDNALRTELLKTPLKLDGGHVLLPEGPGLGIELDPATVKRYRVC
ncbi:mandelate racemase/muconate lactonizing enzyme family protein [Reyranella sp.]|jgi:D-galactarolactone cycloisomerase|uniref:mandelate racemase/muconate lactonizing enzyme family protein n=1 Tax=Reyranella sp. TaxID=1929291 RepID=UPI002F939C4B